MIQKEESHADDAVGDKLSAEYPLPAPDGVSLDGSAFVIGGKQKHTKFNAGNLPIPIRAGIDDSPENQLIPVWTCARYRLGITSDGTANIVPVMQG